MPNKELGPGKPESRAGRRGNCRNSCSHFPLPVIFVLCLALFTACHSPRGLYAGLPAATTVQPACVQKLCPHFSSVVYKTSVDVVGQHLSGLLVFKTMPDSSRRVVFTSETGPTLFDFEFNRGNFQVRYCMKKLNRKAVIRTLQKDFELLLMENPGLPGVPVVGNAGWVYFPFVSGKETNYYITDSTCQQLLGMEKTSRRKQKVVIKIPPFQTGMPDNVKIEHRNFNFAIQLEAINRPNH